VRRFAIVFVAAAAALCNVVFTDLAQDAAYRSYDLLERDSSRYSAVGSVIVPLAADHTFIQFFAFGLPLFMAAVAYWRRWPLAVSTATIVAFELLVVAWCVMTHEFARMPFVTG
jgi:hypothetical protein